MLVGDRGYPVVIGDCAASFTVGDVRVVLLRSTTPQIDELRCNFVEVSPGVMQELSITVSNDLTES